ncbi:hypothetical protein SEA_GUSANITA_62 [Arthrobacter phage Gusanita]|nr:hypothetical protein SEA_GUSANITA_62 [Arthrobacter phage Gusanita]
MKEAIEAALKVHQIKGVRDLRQHCTCGWAGEPLAHDFLGHQAETLHSLLSHADDETAVERAAKALCASEFPEVSPSYAWGVQFEDGQNHYRELARAALAAAKETRT